MSAAPWPKVAVFGAGAVGSYYGGMLARAGGVQVEAAGLLELGTAGPRS